MKEKADNILADKDDKNNAIKLLNKAYLNEQLDLENLEYRIEKVNKAKSIKDLKSLTSDLGKLKKNKLNKKTKLVIVSGLSSLVILFGGVSILGNQKDNDNLLKNTPTNNKVDVLKEFNQPSLKELKKERQETIKTYRQWANNVIKAQRLYFKDNKQYTKNWKYLQAYNPRLYNSKFDAPFKGFWDSITITPINSQKNKRVTIDYQAQIISYDHTFDAVLVFDQNKIYLNKCTVRDVSHKGNDDVYPDAKTLDESEMSAELYNSDWDLTDQNCKL